MFSNIKGSILGVLIRRTITILLNPPLYSKYQDCTKQRSPIPPAAIKILGRLGTHTHKKPFLLMCRGMVVSQDKGTPTWSPKYCNPYYRDPQEGTQNWVGNPPCQCGEAGPQPAVPFTKPQKRNPGFRV